MCGWTLLEQLKCLRTQYTRVRTQIFGFFTFFSDIIHWALATAVDPDRVFTCFLRQWAALVQNIPHEVGADAQFFE